MNNDKISVVVPVRNEADKITQCLEAIFSQSYKPHEVIVIDGQSSDNTVEKAKMFPIRLFYQDYGRAGAARQIGLTHATGDYVAFTDGDCVPDKDWLANLLTGFNGFKLKDEVVGVGGQIINEYCPKNSKK